MYVTYTKVGGVLNKEFDDERTEKSKNVGQLGFLEPIKSSRTMTTATPAGPIFFWAPKKMIPYCNTSNKDETSG